MVVNGLVGVTISTIERRFALASSQTAWIAATYEIVGVPALLVIGYFGSTLRRPVWIGGGLVVLGIGFGIYSIPHFVAPAYRYSGDSSNLCVETAWNTYDNASLPPKDRCTSDEVDDGSKYLAAFIVSVVLQSFGAIPLYVLGIAYLDDASPHGTAAVHIGMFYASSVIGPVVAFICGGFLLELYTHFDTVDTSTITLLQDDPRWVGAWWVAFLALMVSTLIIAPAFFGYPPDPSAKHHREKSTSNRSTDSGQVHEPVLDLRAAGLAGVLKAAKSLVTNGPYMFTVLHATFEAIIVNGFVAFGVKYIQQQFTLTAAMAGIIFGIVAVPGGAGGFLLGGIIIKRMSLTVVQQLRGMFILGIVGVCSMLMFCVQCDHAPLADTTLHRHTQSTGRNVRDTCNLDCSCEMEWFEPVCGADGLTYFSPCSAGCHDFISDIGYGNCSCIGGESTNTSDVGNTVVQGVCDVTSCYTWRLVVYVIMLFIAMVLIFVSEMFNVSSMLRIVKHSERPLAYAISWLFQRVGGGMPGPILFGFAMDHSCLLWEKNCDGTTGACLYYDNHHMAWILLAVCMSCKLFVIVCGLIGWQLYVYKHRKGDFREDRFDISLTVGQTGSGDTGDNYAPNQDVATEVHGNQGSASSNPAFEMENR